ncbi:MAG: MotA/TolQ/ExbB proton channel family protein [Acidobacteriota bacterium]
MKTRDDFAWQVGALLLSLVIVHSIYVLVVRPRAELVLAQQEVLRQEDPTHVDERSVWVIVKDFEQEACFVLFLWALAIMVLKGLGTRRERLLLDEDLVPLAEGTRILPDDAREHARHVEALPPDKQERLLPRALLGALHRFTATGNIQDVSTTAHQHCEVEADRLESELSMVRYIAWAIPSIGFLGTVRGIGVALGRAHEAVEGKIGGVTQSLGVAFNSTFVALIISLVLMFLLHQLQLRQERLILDTETYLDRRLIRHLQVAS